MLALVVFALLSASYFLPLTAGEWQKLEVLGTVLRFNLRGQQPMDDSIRILGITQQFIGTVAKYKETYPPFGRDLQAVVLRRLADSGAKLIVVDILFSEENSWDPDEDGALRDAILYCGRHDCEVILAAGIDVDAVAEGAVARSYELPAPLILEANPWLGITNVAQKLSYRLDEQVTFSLEIADDSFFRFKPIVSAPVMAAWLVTSQMGKEIDVNALAAQGNSYRINYSGRADNFDGQVYGLGTLLPEAFSAEEWNDLGLYRAELKNLAKWGTHDSHDWVPSWSAEQMALQGAQQKAAEAFAGKVVFYGSRNPADNDFFSTPFKDMFGVDTLAHSFDTLLRNRVIKEVSGRALLLTGIVLMLTAWCLSLLRPLRNAVVVGTVLLGVVVAVDLLLFLKLLDLPLAFTTASFLFPFLACTIYGGSVEESERRKIRATFGRYMSDELVAQLVDDPTMADLGGQRIDVAVMFVDIRNYSTLTEHLDPQQSVWMLNTLLGEITDVIRSNDGFVDKYLGDGLLACFGGPVRTREPARDAVAAALEMLVVLHRDVNPKLSAVNLPELRIGIGIHFGPVVMGNIGSESRMEFTVVGDSVNVAARVESCTKETGWAVLVTREVTEAAPEFTFEPVGEQLVKGREQAVELYRPIYAELEDKLRL